MESNSAGDLAGAEAAGAHIDVLGRAVHHSLDALHVGLPGAVGFYLTTFCPRKK